MIERIYHWLSGYVEFRVEGDGARLFTMAAKRGMGLWGFGRSEGKAVARVKPGGYKRLRPLFRRCGASGRITRKRGMPFQFMRLWARKGLILGAFLGIALFRFLSGFVWEVSVSGIEDLLPSQVLEAAMEGGVYVGADRESMRAGNPEGIIQTLLPELSWVSVNTDGCFAEVAVKEGTKKPEIEDKEELSNIVALRAGKIVKIEAREGRPEVKLGEPVTPGQLLIAGLYEEELDPWGSRTEPYRRAGAARGSVIAETVREFTVQVSGTIEEPVETGRRSSLWLEVLGVRVPLGLTAKSQGDMRVWYDRWQANVLGTPLPITVERRTEAFLEIGKRALNEEELKAAALRKLREAQRTELPKGSSVKEEELEFYFSDGLCILSARCRCWEEIGLVQKILVE